MKRTAVVVAAFLVLASGAVALAAIPSADGTITGCRKNSNGTIRVIDAEAGQQCQAGETALTWNQTGPQGPAGQPGPQGPPGQNGISGYELVRIVGTVGGDGTATSSLECPEGKVAFGGGGGSADLDFKLSYSMPSVKEFNGILTAIGWLAGGRGTPGTTFQLWAICGFAA
jgi:hypothetical protein